MKIAITGHTGFIGSRLIKDYDFLIPLDGDIRDPDVVKKEMNRISPDMVIHCAAKTGVKFCEENITEALEVNVGGVRNILDNFFGDKFLFLSTDHVFSGSPTIRERLGYFGKWLGYRETHRPNPINNYGLTKFAGEGMAITTPAKTVIMRMSSVIEHTFEGWSDVPDFIFRSFTSLYHVSSAIGHAIEMFDGLPDVVHIGSNRPVSYFEYYSCLNRYLETDLVIGRRRTPKDGFIPRPFMAGLNTKLAKELGFDIPTLEEAVHAS